MLSAVSVILRGIGVSFNAYINNKIGSESMGLFTLVMSIYGFALTVALSCVNLGSVKLTSERCARLVDAGADKKSWQKALRSLMLAVISYSALFGVGAGVLLYFLSSPIAKYLLRDIRCINSLKLISLSLPAIAFSSAIAGFFTGMRKVYKNAVASVSEQLVRIVIISTALFMLSPGDVEKACTAVVGGSALSEAWSLIVNLLMYLFDSKKPGDVSYGNNRITLVTRFKNIADISFVASVGNYARQGLSTLEHLAIPAGLKRSGLDKASALSAYGLLHGIAFPLVMFPYAVIGSFTSLLIPEMAERHELGDREGIRRLTSTVYRYSAVFSVGACAVFVNYASELGQAVYNSSDAAVYTLTLGLLAPFMYLDTAIDSLLKGLGEQIYNMKVNIADSAVGLLLVLILTPLLGLNGYIITLWVCETANLAASFYRLYSITSVSVRELLGYYAFPIAVFGTITVLKFTILSKMKPFISFAVFILIYIFSVVIYETKKEKRLSQKLKSLMIRGGIEPPFTP